MAGRPPARDRATIGIAVQATSNRTLKICNLYSITTNQAAISALFRVVNRYVGNLAPMPGVFPDYNAPIVRAGADGRELVTRTLGHALVVACADGGDQEARRQA